MAAADTALKGRTVWITGASSGIGRALAVNLSSRAKHLILTSRNRQHLTNVANSITSPVSIVAADLSEASATEVLRGELDKFASGIDTVILCAGDCEYVDMQNFDSDIFKRMFNVNVLGLVRSVEAALPALRKSQRAPHIVGISSASAIAGLPRAEAYGASKRAVVGMLESLALDLYQEGIVITAVLPGFVDTPLTRRNDFPMPFLMSSEHAAKIILNGIEAGKRRIEFPRKLIWPLKLFAMLPAGVRLKLGQYMVKK